MVSMYKVNAVLQQAWMGPEAAKAGRRDGEQPEPLGFKFQGPYLIQLSLVQHRPRAGKVGSTNRFALC